MTDQSRVTAWLVTDSDAEHPGKLVARLAEGDHTGGSYVADIMLMADTLADLRALMPPGLTVHEGPFLEAVLEVWD
jgi:hypothetical protein